MIVESLMCRSSIQFIEGIYSGFLLNCNKESNCQSWRRSVFQVVSWLQAGGQEEPAVGHIPPVMIKNLDIHIPHAMRDFFLQRFSFNNNDYLSYDSLFWDLASERILKIRWGQSTSIVCSLPCREQQCRRPSSSRSQSHHPVKKEIILKDSHHVSISTNLQQSFTLPHQLGAVVRQPLLKEHLDIAKGLKLVHINKIWTRIRW